MSEAEREAEARSSPPIPAYSWYVLGVLVLIYVLNFVDRQILSILAEDIKRDLGLRDEDLGFLYGTAFGVFYALFGIPLGRLADNWHRVRLITAGLTLWSTMTALSGLSRTGGMLAAARVGVGVGEATASPSAYSLISDWFPKHRRATALAIYSAGLYLGGGLSLGIGGLVVQRWNAAYPDGGPLNLAGWQAAFLAVGLPGLTMALWVASLREPVRGQSEGLATPPHPAPFRALGQDLVAIIPPLTLIGAVLRGPRELAVNLGAAALIALAVWGLVALGEPIPHWAAVGIGVYAVFSWMSDLRLRDRPTFALIAGTPAFVAIVIAYGLNSFIAYAVGFWAAPYAMRDLGISPATAGTVLGSLGALAGFLGVTLGGLAADRLRRRHPAGRIVMVLFGSVAPIAPLIVAFTTSQTSVFYAMLFVCQLTAASALGAAAASTQDLVLPRMRGTATGTFFIGTTLTGLALGPYLAGRISTLSGSLTTGLLSLLAVTPIALAAGFLAFRLLPASEASREARARAAGEVI
jgi:MFS family permease